jgi:prepilin-type N-terminal cleavage/methylation domain-containing protein
MKIPKSNNKGMSLLEILIVLTIFAVLGILLTRAIILTLQGSQKAVNTIRVRENLNYALGVMERQLRNANEVTGDCTGAEDSVVNYLDQFGNIGSFTCVNPGQADSFIASGSGSARLTGDTVSVAECHFTCLKPTPAPGTIINPAKVGIDITLEAANTSGIQKVSVSASTQVYLRTY